LGGVVKGLALADRRGELNVESGVIKWKIENGKWKVLVNNMCGRGGNLPPVKRRE